MPPAVKAGGGKSKSGAAPGASAQTQQRTIQTRSQKAGLQVSLINLEPTYVDHSPLYV